MENGKEEVKTETVNNVSAGEVKDEKPVSNAEENSTIKTENPAEPSAESSVEPSAELLEKIKNQVEVLFW